MTHRPTAVVVGGTGPTGPHVVNGLIDRGYEVVLFHRGTHESDEIPEIEHIHGDPHFAETIAEALGDRQFDLVVAMYGRVRFLAQHFAGKTKKFISVGSVSATRGHFVPEALYPKGLALNADETSPVVANAQEPDGKFAWRIADTERQILELHPSATILRYPLIYGPNQLLFTEWTMIRRALDRRPFLILPDGGLRISMRGYAVNMAHAVLCAVDRPEAAAGQIFNCGDDTQLTMRQMADVVAHTVGHEWEILSLPARVAVPAWYMNYTDPKGSWHRLYGTTKLQQRLGYRDVVDPVAGLATTSQWYLDRKDTHAEDIEKRLGDPFDYAAEDTLAGMIRKFEADVLATIQSDHELTPHPYAHPDKPNQATDKRGR